VSIDVVLEFEDDEQQEEAEPAVVVVVVPDVVVVVVLVVVDLRDSLRPLFLAVFRISHCDNDAMRPDRALPLCLPERCRLEECD